MANNCSNILRILTSAHPSHFVGTYPGPDFPEPLDGEYFADELFAQTKGSPRMYLRTYTCSGKFSIEPPFGNRYDIEVRYDTRWGPDENFLEEFYQSLVSIDPDCYVENLFFEPGCCIGGVWENGNYDRDDGPNCRHSDMTGKYVFLDWDSVPDWFTEFADCQTYSEWQDVINESAGLGTFDEYAEEEIEEIESYFKPFIEDDKETDSQGSGV